MSPPAGTIDLGELPHARHDTVDRPWPVRQRLDRWRRLPVWRIAGTAATVAAVLATVVGAAAPSRPPVPVRYTVNGVSFTIDDENVYVVERAGSPDQATLVSYRQADGAVRWRSEPLPMPADAAWVTNRPEALMVIGQTQLDGSGGERTIRVDPATGRVLWTAEGSPAARASGGVFPFGAALRAEPSTDDGFPSSFRMSGVDAMTGAIRWHRDVPEQWRYQAGGDRFVTMSPDGRELRSYEISTGEPVASVTLPPRDDQPELMMLSAHVIVTSGYEQEPSWDAYDLDTLDHRWSVRPEVPWGTMPYECFEGLVCATGDRPAAFDPATGDLLWSADWLAEDTFYDMQPLAAPDLAGLMLLVGFPASGNPRDPMRQRYWLADARTGELVLDLGRWAIPSFGYRETRPAEGRMATASADGVLWVGRLRPDLTGVDPVVAIPMPAAVRSPERFNQCGVWTTRVFCVSESITRNVGMTGWQVTIWPLPA